MIGGGWRTARCVSASRSELSHCPVKYTAHRAERAGAVTGDDDVLWREASERNKDFRRRKQPWLGLRDHSWARSVFVNECDQHQCFQAQRKEICDANLRLYFFVCFRRDKESVEIMFFAYDKHICIMQPCQRKSREAGRERKGREIRGHICVTTVFIKFLAGQPLTGPCLNLLNSVKVYYFPIRSQPWWIIHSHIKRSFPHRVVIFQQKLTRWLAPCCMSRGEAQTLPLPPGFQLVLRCEGKACLP